MRHYLAVSSLILGALLSFACVAAEVAPAPTNTPSLYQGPVEGRTPGPGAADSDATAGRLPPRGPAPAAAASTPTAYALDSVLQKRLQDLLGDGASHFGVYVKDLTTGRGAGVNTSQVFNAASLFKLEVMYEVFRQRDLGLVDLDEMLEITPYYGGFDLGTRPVEVGQKISIADALSYMMSVSDNVSAVLLQDRVGAGNVNQTMSALGLKASGLFTDGLPATSADFGVLLEAIARSAPIAEDSRTRMIELLKSETFDNGVAAGVPRGTEVAHKTGNWTDATNDAAIVLAPKGPYVLVVLSDADHETSGVRAISQLVYGYLEDGR